MNKGRLIVFEGIEGCGKTTQSRILTERLKAEGLTAVWTCEPGGCRLGEQIRSIIKDKYSVCPLSELMLLEAARAQHVRELIEPALNKGVTVVCDRFIGSTLAYQSALGIDIALIEELNSIALGGIAPDITFLLDADAHLSFCRVLQRGCPDRIEAKGQAYFEAVRSNYLQLAAKHGWFVLDASQPIDSLADEILKYTSLLFNVNVNGNILNFLE